MCEDTDQKTPNTDTFHAVTNTRKKKNKKQKQKRKHQKNTTARKYFFLDNKPDQVHCKLENNIYLLKGTHHDISYVGESITRGERECEISIDNYRNVCKNTTSLMQVIEELL